MLTDPVCTAALWSLSLWRLSNLALKFTLLMGLCFFVCLSDPLILLVSTFLFESGETLLFCTLFMLQLWQMCQNCFRHLKVLKNLFKCIKCTYCTRASQQAVSVPSCFLWLLGCMSVLLWLIAWRWASPFDSCLIFSCCLWSWRDRKATLITPLPTLPPLTMV